MNLSNRLRAIEEAMHRRRPDLRPLSELADPELWAILRQEHPELPPDPADATDEQIEAIAGEGRQ